MKGDDYTWDETPTPIYVADVGEKPTEEEKSN